MKTRKVLIFKWEKQNRPNGSSFYALAKDGAALFHQWGISYEEFEDGPGQYSTAIIEREDGTVENVPVELIKFIE